MTSPYFHQDYLKYWSTLSHRRSCTGGFISRGAFKRTGAMLHQQNRKYFPFPTYLLGPFSYKKMIARFCLRDFFLTSTMVIAPTTRPMPSCHPWLLHHRIVHTFNRIILIIVNYWKCLFCPSIKQTEIRIVFFYFGIACRVQSAWMRKRKLLALIVAGRACNNFQPMVARWSLLRYTVSMTHSSIENSAR